MLSWVMSWSKLEQSCLNLLKDPTLREPIEDLKYLNIDYTQFNGWSSDEEVTIYTGIEKGYEKWLLDGPDSDDGKISEKEASSDEEFDHSIDFENYNDPDKYLVPEDYLRNFKPEENTMKAEELEKKEDNEETKMDVCQDKLTAGVKSDVQEDSQESPNDPAAETKMEKRSSAKDKKSGKQPEEKSAKKRKADSEINPEVLLDEFCKENPDSPMVGKPETKTMEVDK
ncbi:uncharacterized protein LOC111700783 [Eurytemora carolleeae]|uniref:uncharacterized protein LOC111700783 n=1 Tax=Eurytemora carolleeae TaxID=1294199 RepID=UPI000C78919C|nr:uncharacterized protein LOC111700783 [Eurytemora carolleeae]|eukprot:XP_023327590.1 uncharacterized protein LOC111700783 [Eurytemora affinis]